MMCEITNKIEISQMCETLLSSTGNDTSLLKTATVTIIKLLLLSGKKNLCFPPDNNSYFSLSRWF